MGLRSASPEGISQNANPSNGHSSRYWLHKTFPYQLTIQCDRLLQQMFSDNTPHHIHPFSQHRCVPPAEIQVSLQISPASGTAQQSPEMYHDCFGHAMLAATVNTSWLLVWWSSVPVAVRARGILNVFNEVFLSPSRQKFGKSLTMHRHRENPCLEYDRCASVKILVAVEELLMPIPKTFAKSTHSLHVTKN
jgi:hypothetical protein